MTHHKHTMETEIEVTEYFSNKNFTVTTVTFNKQYSLHFESKIRYYFNLSRFFCDFSFFDMKAQPIKWTVVTVDLLLTLNVVQFEFVSKNSTGGLFNMRLVLNEGDETYPQENMAIQYKSL